jgi:hypothetical protein
MVPILVCLLTIIMRYVVDVQVYTQNIRYAPQAINNFTSANQSVLSYSPSNKELLKLVEGVAETLRMTVNQEKDLKSLEIYAMAEHPFVSIEFDDSYNVS